MSTTPATPGPEEIEACPWCSASLAPREAAARAVEACAEKLRVHGCMCHRGPEPINREGLNHWIHCPVSMMERIRTAAPAIIEQAVKETK